MGHTLGQLRPFAVAVTISPMPIAAMVLMLITPRAKANGFTFLLGWAMGIAAVGAVVLIVAGPLDAGSGVPDTWARWLKLLAGLLLLMLAVQQWRRRRTRDDQAALPRWMGALDRFTPVRAGALAIALTAANPKNLVFVVGGATVVAQADLSTADEVVAWVGFTVIATSGVAIPMGIYLLLGDRAMPLLLGLKTWMARNNTAVIAVLLVIVGAKLIADAILPLLT